MAYYVYYIVNFTANVPMLDSILLFIQYYLAFGILFGLLILLAFRLLRKAVFRFLTIAAAHAAFMPMFYHELNRFPTGSFFNGFAP